MRARLLLPLLMVAGCAWEPGESFGVLEPSVRVSYAPEGDRQGDNGYLRLASSYQARVTAATMQLESVELIPRRTATGGGRFDPANPPPGYSLCHGGHCHRADGALIPYEDIEAELDGGGAPVLPLVTLPVGEVNLFNPELRSVSCEPTCELPRTELATGRWAIMALRLEGTVRDGLTTPRFPGERAFRLELPATANGSAVAVVEGDLEVPSDRAHAPRVLLRLLLDVPSRIFDEVDWSATQPGQDGIVDLSTHAAARAAILEGLEAVNPTVEVQREDR
jgi:hypothetical protein